MKEPFYFIVTPFKEESEGQLAEITRLCENARMSYLSAEKFKNKGDIAEIAVSYENATVPRNALLFCSPQKNPDLITAVRTALAMGAKGIIVPVGNNPNRDYIRDGRAYLMKSAIAANEEIKRVAPLFSRTLERVYHGSSRP